MTKTKRKIVTGSKVNTEIAKAKAETIFAVLHLA